MLDFERKNLFSFCWKRKSTDKCKPSFVMSPFQNPLLCSSTELRVEGCLDDVVHELPEHGGGEEEGTHHPAAGQAAGHQERQQHGELGGRARRQGHQGSHQVFRYLQCTLQITNTENPKQIFPEKELRSHSPSFHIPRIPPNRPEQFLLFRGKKFFLGEIPCVSG